MNFNGKDGKLNVKHLSYSTIHTARDGVDELDRIRREKKISQMSISELADMPDEGTQYYRMYKSGDITISKYLRFLKALGYQLVIMKEE